MFSQTTYSNDTINLERAFGTNLISRKPTVPTSVPTGKYMQFTTLMTIEEANKHVKSFDVGRNTLLLLNLSKEKDPENESAEFTTKVAEYD